MVLDCVGCEEQLTREGIRSNTCLREQRELRAFALVYRHPRTKYTKQSGSSARVWQYLPALTGLVGGGQNVPWGV
jgi:hypothetical protein